MIGRVHYAYGDTPDCTATLTDAGRWECAGTSEAVTPALEALLNQDFDPAAYEDGPVESFGTQAVLDAAAFLRGRAEWPDDRDAAPNTVY